MNPSVPNSPMASLLMSLGGSIDLNRLELTNDGASGLSEFSQLLNGMQLSALPEGIDDQLPELSTSLSAAMPEGQNLPLGLPLSVSSASGDDGAVEGLLPELSDNSSALDATDVSSETLMAQIRDGQDIRVRYADLQEQTESVEQVGDLNDEAGQPGLNSEVPSGLPGQAVPGVLSEPSVSPLASSVRAQNTQDSRPLAAQRAASRNTDGHPSSVLSDPSAEEASVDSDVSELFRPVTADEDGPSGLSQRDTLMSPQNTVLTSSAQVNPNPAAAAGLTIAAAAQSTETAASDALQDASEAGEYSAEEGFEQKLERQLKERLDFGQDRREWTPALGARLVTMVATDVQHARIQLDPPELGSLEIKMQIQHDQASVQVSAQSHQVKDVLDNGAQRLRDALAAEGIELNEFSVAADGGRQGGEDAGRDGSGDGQGSGGLAGEDGIDGDDPAAAKQVHVPAPDALLDTFA